jgi:amidase
MTTSTTTSFVSRARIDNVMEERNADHVVDEPSKYVDAPISLQLVGRRYEDEKLIEAMELITQAASLPLAKE